MLNFICSCINDQYVIDDLKLKKYQARRYIFFTFGNISLLHLQGLVVFPLNFLNLDFIIKEIQKDFLLKSIIH